MIYLRPRLLMFMFVLLCGMMPWAAQAQNASIFDVLRALFGGAPPQSQQPDKPKKPRKPHVALPLKSGPGNGVNTVYGPPMPPQFFVYVLGDSLGTMMGQGLTEALSDTSAIAVVKQAKDASGLVRESFFDWTKASEDLLASTDKLDVAIMMIGANDHQPFVRDGKVVADIDTEEWDKLYKARVEAIANLFRDRQIPLIWVGVPIMRSGTYSNEMYKLNEIDRDVVTSAGATFVDTWDAFANERGDYDQNGPDINGQQVRLRTSDGIHFTIAGQRKLASFVERDIRRIFEERKPAQDTLTAPQLPPEGQDANGAKVAKAPVKKERPVSGPVFSLSNPPRTASGELVTPVNTRQPLSAVPVSTEEAHPGRADDFVWPQH